MQDGRFVLILSTMAINKEKRCIDQILSGISACIFDMDGTLVDSLGIWDDIDIRFFHEHSMEVPKDYDKIISHMSFMEMAIFTKETYHIQESVEEIASTWLEWSKDAYLHTIVAKPGAKDALEYIKGKGIPMSLATTNKEELYLPCLERNHLLSYFSHIENVNHLHTKKSEPKIYQTLAKDMQAPIEKTIVFEDILMAVDTAKKAGFVVCGVYDKRNNPDKEKIQSIADYFIEDYPGILL